MMSFRGWAVGKWILGMNVLSLLPLLADLRHVPASKQAPSLVAQYELIDLGENDLEVGLLTRMQDALSLGPRINDRAGIIGNRRSGGFIITAAGLEYAPQIEGVRISHLAINNHGDLLINILRPGCQMEWYVWPTANGWNEPRLLIDPVELMGCQLSLSKINDFQQVVGNAHPDERSMPIKWSRSQGLYRLGHDQHLDLLGYVKDLNLHSLVVGKSQRLLEQFPFAWDKKKLTSLFKYRRLFNPPPDGKIMFEDLLLTDEGTAYGTYWINTDFLNVQAPEARKYRGFAWHLPSDTLTLFNMGGMRLAAINGSCRMVGSLEGKACFRDAAYSPMELAHVIVNPEIADWELLEATDINGNGQIVGYGRKGGKMHLFLANPL